MSHLLYFLAGVIAFPLAAALLKKRKPKLSKKKWDTIQHIRIDTEFDHTFEREFTGEDLAKLLGGTINNFIIRKTPALRNFTVKPVPYTIKIDIFARFTQREEESCDLCRRGDTPCITHRGGSDAELER